MRGRGSWVVGRGWVQLAGATILLAGCSHRLEVLGAPPDASGGSGPGSGTPPAGGSSGSSATGGSGGLGGDSPSGGSAGQMEPDPEDPELGFSIAAGDAHSCATRSGALYCWGDNAAGRLGLGDETDRDLPARVGLDADYVSVAAGSGHTCAQKADGSVHCFGANDQGQLGRSDVGSSLTPLPVTLPEPVTRLDSTANHACVVLESGVLQGWGYNIEGGLGLGDTHPGMNQFAPVTIGAESDWFALGAGQGHTCALRAAGSLYCWGRNTAANLGLGSNTEQQRREPTLVGTDSDWESVASGQDASCGIRAGGALYCWGANEFGTLGLGDRTQRMSPTEVAADRTWVQVSLDTFHACAIDSSATLYCWGRNIEGQLGTGDIEDRLEPTPVGEGYQEVAVGRFHTCAVTSEGRFFCTGQNADGRLGVGGVERTNVFTEVALPD